MWLAIASPGLRFRFSDDSSLTSSFTDAWTWSSSTGSDASVVELSSVVSDSIKVSLFVKKKHRKGTGGTLICS